jgi:hypothetical protein
MAATWIADYVGQNKTAGTTVTTAVTASVGDTLVGFVAWDPSGATLPTISTISDGSANVYTKLGSPYPAPATTSSLTGVMRQDNDYDEMTAFADRASDIY